MTKQLLREEGNKEIGHDPAAFMTFGGSELLYWSHILEKHQLIQFNAARLTAENGVNCEMIPRRTATYPEKILKIDSPSSAQSFNKSNLLKYVDNMGRNRLGFV